MIMPEAHDKSQSLMETLIVTLGKIKKILPKKNPNKTINTSCSLFILSCRDTFAPNMLKDPTNMQKIKSILWDCGVPKENVFYLHKSYAYQMIEINFHH